MIKIDVNRLTDVMREYVNTKEEYKDAVLFYRMGDFYEFFFEDAVEMSRVLDLTLTGKDCGLDERAPMCGIPFHAAENYINKLIKMGYKVAICEQTDGVIKNKKGKTMMKREVVRIVTPGTVVEESLLEEKKNNYLASIYQEDDNIGVSYCDISTGEFECYKIGGEFALKELNDILVRIMPSEVLCNSNFAFEKELPICKLGLVPKFTRFEDFEYEEHFMDSKLAEQFGNDYKTKYKLKDKYLVISSGKLIDYIFNTQKRALGHINNINISKNEKFMIIDINTRRNLEILETIKDRRKKGSLIGVLDKTKTSMGARLMRSWIDQPLNDAKEINARLDSVQELYSQIMLRDSITEQLIKVNDIERISGRIAYGTNFTPKDCVALRNSLAILPNLQVLLETTKSKKLAKLSQNIPNFSEIVDLLNNAIVNEPPTLLSNGGYIKEGFNAQLDEYKEAMSDGKKWLIDFEQREREKTGIKNLKVAYNRVFGYYIEVNKSLASGVPFEYQRKQTIANNERFITEELKVLEDKLLNASECSIKLEQALFQEIRNKLFVYIPQLQTASKIIAELDCLISFANIAVKNNYTKPIVSDKCEHLKIIEGRHPVVEDLLNDDRFVANDTYLNTTTDRTMVITGPNMAGKSTYMRQVAVITLMAHIGSFVPARQAELPVVDRIFTRVGASDDLAFGQSTFMVEMMEVAEILKNATDSSLIVLDEIGRGTSTFDGLSIAWAVVEFLSKKLKAKTLFATHYHELTELESFLDGVKNYKISVKEFNGTVIFLRKIVRGGASRSFGIEVAQLAGVPDDVIERAKEISKGLEQTEMNKTIVINTSENKDEVIKKDVSYTEIVGILKDIDMNKMSPICAFETLYDLVQRATK